MFAHKLLGMKTQATQYSRPYRPRPYQDSGEVGINGTIVKEREGYDIVILWWYSQETRLLGSCSRVSMHEKEGDNHSNRSKVLWVMDITHFCTHVDISCDAHG